MINDTIIARSIAMIGVINCEFANNFVVEDADPKFAAYDGVVIANHGRTDKCVHVYLCDDDKDSEIWMVDSTNLVEGTVDPRPLTAGVLQRALEWLIAEAWLVCQYGEDNESITTERPTPEEEEAFGTTSQPLVSVPGGTLVAWFDPTTGDFSTDTDKQLGEPSARFTKPLYTVVRS